MDKQILLNSILIPFLSVFAGGLITWLVSYLYYQKSSEDLSKEARRLRSLANLTLESLEQAGLAELVRDELGNIVGPKRLILHPSPTESIGVTERVDVAIPPTEKSTPD